MSHKAAKIGATSIVLVAAFGMLLYSTLGESMQYYKYVDEVVAQPSVWEGKKLQVHGNVVPKSIKRKRESLEYVFDLQRNGKVIRAYYGGIVPDTFKDDAEVVLKGTLSPSGFEVEPNGVMAKCPSKYEAKPGGVASAKPPGV
jgi:cytochrome c-type biogenesis protein CcmE